MIEPTNQTGSNSANLLQMIEKIKQNSRIAAQVDYKQELLHGICTKHALINTINFKNQKWQIWAWMKNGGILNRSEHELAVSMQSAKRR